MEEKLPDDVRDLNASRHNKPPPSSLEIPWAYPEQAKKENETWSDLENVKHINTLRWTRVYGWIVLGVTITFSFIFLCAFLIWSWHYLTPWTWLDDEKLNKIQTVLFSGSMGAMLRYVFVSKVQGAES